MSELLSVPPELERIIRDNYRKNRLSQTGAVSLEESIVIASAVYRYKPQLTLEIGFASGVSAAAVLAAKAFANISEAHIVVDPYQNSHSNSVGLKYVDELGYSERLILVNELSENYLPRIVADKKFDFILIDGGHSSGQAMVDAYFADRCLHLGGIVMIDDIYMRSTANSIRYLVDECGYEIIRSNNKRPSFIRIARRSARLGIRFALAHTFRSTNALAILRKSREFFGGY